VRELKAQGLGATEIAQALGIGQASVYRVLETNRPEVAG
jgi:DNA-binding IclR family transcriptional regulator